MRFSVFLLIFLGFSGAFAGTGIIPNGENGETYMDASTMTLHLNVKTTAIGGDFQTPEVKCHTGPSGAPVNNYFRLKLEGPDGVVRDRPIIRFGTTCEAIKTDPEGVTKDGSKIIACDALAGAQVTVGDPLCNGAACPQGPETTRSVDFRLNNQKVIDEIKKCSPKDQLLLVRDRVSKNVLFTNVSDGKQCTLDRKRVIIGDSDWDNGDSLFTNVYTSDRGGFFVSNISHYYFDFQSNSWCIQLRADLANSPPVCSAGFTNLTHAIDFAVRPPVSTETPKPEKVNYLRGAIRLSIKDGVPIAEICNANEKTAWTRRPTLNEDGVCMKVEVSKNEKDGLVTKFHSNGPGKQHRRTLTVAQSHVFGKNMTAGACDGSSCLRTIPEVSGTSPDASELSCKNTEPFDLTSDSKANLCYSCNGVFGGNCQKLSEVTDPNDPPRSRQILTQANYTDAANKLRACQQGTFDPSTEETEVFK